MYSPNAISPNASTLSTYLKNDQSTSFSSGAEGGHIKLDNDPLPADFLQKGKSYMITSRHHADDKKRTDFRTKKYVYIGLNQERGKFHGGHVFGLAHAWNKTIVFSASDMIDLRLEKVGEFPKTTKSADAENSTPATSTTTSEAAPVIEQVSEELVQNVEQSAENIAAEDEVTAIPSDVSNAAQDSNTVDTKEGKKQKMSSAPPRVPYFQVKRSGVDMNATFDGSAPFFEKAKPFLQTDKAEITYSLLNDLRGHVTNKMAYLLIIVSQQSEKRRDNLARSLSAPSLSDARKFAKEVYERIFEELSGEEISHYHDILKYGCEYLDLGISVPDKTIQAGSSLEADISTNPSRSETASDKKLENDVPFLAQLLLETMAVPERMIQRAHLKPDDKDKQKFSDEYFEHKTIIDMAVKVLNPQEFSMLAFYMRPLGMRAPQDPKRWIPLPVEIDAYRKDLKLSEREEIAYIAASKIKISDEYQANVNSGYRKSDKSTGCTRLRRITEELALKVSPEIVSAAKAIGADKKESKKGEPMIEVPEPKEDKAEVSLRGTKAILKDVLNTLPKRDNQIINKAYAQALTLASDVLEPEEFAIISFYLRPKKMFMGPRTEGQEDARTALPASAHQYHYGKGRPAIYKLAFDASEKLISSDEFAKANQENADEDISKAIGIVTSLKQYLEKKLNPKNDNTQIADKTTVSEDKGQTDKPQAAVKVSRVKSAVTVKATEMPVAAQTPSAPEVTAVVQPAPAPTPTPAPSAQTSFNNVSGVLEEERKNIQRFSPQDGLLGYFAEVAGLGTKSLALISMTMLRKEKLAPKDAADKLGLDFEDAAAMVEGAISKIKLKAVAGNDNFVLDYIKDYKFA